MTLVIFVEEESMKVALDQLIPKLGLNVSSIQILPHHGVQDLERSVRNKLPIWNAPDTSFLIIRDNDSGDCKARKESLMKIVRDAGKDNTTTVRIVCQELEAWFLGDPIALEAAGYLAKGKRPQSVRGNPDEIRKPSETLARLSKKGPWKVIRASEIARHMNPENNNSVSFKHTMTSLKYLGEQNG